MLMIPLQSGSNGNSIYVESGDVRLLFDAGISGAQAIERLGAYGRHPAGIDALFVSHDHSDHVRGVGVFTRKFGIPLYVTERTLKVSRRRMQLGDLRDIQHFRAGDAVKIGHVTVETVGTPHDAVDGSVFVVDDGKFRLGICTDVGHVYNDLEALVATVDGLFIESNYDERMLAMGSYPQALKRRISGPGGHISNVDAANLVARNATSRLQWICLAHLSAENNRPDLALAAHRELLGVKLPIYVASRYGVSTRMDVRKGALAFDVPRRGATIADAIFGGPRRGVVAVDDGASRRGAACASKGAEPALFGDHEAGSLADRLFAPEKPPKIVTRVAEPRPDGEDDSIFAQRGVDRSVADLIFAPQGLRRMRTS